MSIAELTASFSIEQISPKASVFDEKKLEWMNGLYLSERSVASLTEEVIPKFRERGWLDTPENADDTYCYHVIELLRDRSKRLTELVDSAEYFFNDPVGYEEKAAKKNFSTEAAGHLELLNQELVGCPDFSGSALEALFRATAESSSLQTGKLIHPVRLAVSGVSFGPGLFELLETLGRERVLRRIDKAVEYIRKNIV
jgi:glutamyl-tRNA synthetase